MTLDELYMSRCLQLARNGETGAPPNPMVGAVIVCDGRIIGEGYHRRCGEAHAEVNAVRSVGAPSLLSRSTMYVSLEPCSHWGKTPPCAQLIIDNGIPEVVVGCTDPFAKVSGRGIRMLRDAGINVRTGILEDECRKLNRKFFTCHTLNRPYITLKWAQSADRYIDITRTGGDPFRLSSPHSALRVQHLRAQHQAILVGTNTARLDNPRLSLRVLSGRQPLRIAIDRSAVLPDSLNLFDGSQPTLIIGTRDDKQRHKRGNYDFLKLKDGAPLLATLLRHLHERGIQSLLVEGGSLLHRSFIDSGMWDEIHIEATDHILGNGVAAPRLSSDIALKAEYRFGATFLHASNASPKGL